MLFHLPPLLLDSAPYYFRSNRAPLGNLAVEKQDAVSSGLFLLRFLGPYLVNGRFVPNVVKLGWPAVSSSPPRAHASNELASHSLAVDAHVFRVVSAREATTAAEFTAC